VYDCVVDIAKLLDDTFVVVEIKGSVVVVVVIFSDDADEIESSVESVIVVVADTVVWKSSLFVAEFVN
jgi:hypothetical protein